MFYKKFIYCYFIFYSPFISAHSFYKTMPKEVEHIYDELKQLEREAINAFKKAYPKIPAHLWDNLDFIEKQTQTWLSDTAMANNVSKQLTMPLHSFEKEMPKYCFNFLEHECTQQGVDFRKIDIQYQELDKTVLATAKGPTIKEYDKTEYISFFELCSGKLSFYYGINSTEQCIITIDIKKFIKQKEYYKNQALKHELAHVTEAHTPKNLLIYDLIICYYGVEELKNDLFIHCYTNYQKIQETLAQIVPALLSTEYATKYYDNIEEFTAPTSIHPSSKTIIVWLKKIHWALFKAKIVKILNYINIFS